MNITKFSQSLATPVYDALGLEARRLGREPHEHIQRVLTQHVIDKESIAHDDAERLQLVWRVVDRCVRTARRICHDGGFSEDITLHAIQHCTRDPNWLQDEALPAMLRAVDDDVTGIVPIEDRHTRSPVELEWIGLGHALEGPAVTTRGTNSTSIDAFMIARTPAGRRAYLMEWKYVEE